jgi:2-C-methyl-D-erythritol 4-phosphate cytidylyltransferase
MTTAVIVVAAGRGTRLGPGVPKALRPLRGEPMIVHAVRAVVGASSVSQVVVAAPSDDVELVQRLLEPVVREPVRLAVLAGGADRAGSVARALEALEDDIDVVLVHDAARALAPSELVERVCVAVRNGAPAVIPVLDLPDTVKQLAPDGSVVATLDRSALCAVQTPQGFDRAVLEAAHRAASGHPPTLSQATDDAGLVERIGVKVQTIPGAQEAFKVTRGLDLLLAEAVLERGISEGER